MGDTDVRRVGYESANTLEAAWSQAEIAAKRSGGQLRGLVRQDDVLSLEPQWLAWSKGDSGELPVEGTGDTPTDALLALAKALGERR